MTKPDEVKAPPFWAMYVGVPNLEDAVAHIKQLGGATLTSHRRADRRPHADDEGPARRGVLHHRAGESREQPPEGAPEVGEASWHELMTTDAPRGDEVLPAGLRLAAERRDGHGAMGNYQMFNRPHGMIGGMMNKPPEMAHVPPNWEIYFRVPAFPSDRADQGERRAI